MSTLLPSIVHLMKWVREKFLGDLVGWLDQQIDEKQQVLYKVGRL